MATIDQQFVEYIVKTLVNNPDKVVVDREIDERGVLLSLSVDPEDVGRVIGKRGRYNLKIVNTDEEGAAPVAHESADELAAAAATEVDAVATECDDLAEKTRAELADLDDLDV